jgi:hypothetical protein
MTNSKAKIKDKKINNQLMMIKHEDASIIYIAVQLVHALGLDCQANTSRRKQVVHQDFNFHIV